MTDDIDWELLAKKYQRENEDLRLLIYKKINSGYKFDIGLEEVSDFITKYYIPLIFAVIVLSYIGSFLIDLYTARKENGNGRRKSS